MKYSNLRSSANIKKCILDSGQEENKILTQYMQVFTYLQVYTIIINKTKFHIELGKIWNRILQSKKQELWQNLTGTIWQSIRQNLLSIKALVEK